MRNKNKDEVNVEGTVTRRGTVQACSRCGDTTHNIRKCTKPPPDEPIKRKRKTRTKDTNSNSEEQTSKATSTGATTLQPSKRYKRAKGTTGASTSTHQAQSSTQNSTSTIPNTQPGQSPRPPRSRQSNRSTRGTSGGSNTNGPQGGIGNWNGMGMLNEFRAPVQGGQNNSSQIQVNNFSAGGNIQMQVHNTRFGSAMFSSRPGSSKSKRSFITDIGDS